MGWDIANMSRGASYGGGLTKSYRDFHEVLTFLGSSGPLFDVIQRLMHDPSHVYEFQTSQLPQSFQKNNLRPIPLDPKRNPIKFPASNAQNRRI